MIKNRFSFIIISIFSIFLLTMNVKAIAGDLSLTGLLASGVYEGDTISTQNNCVIKVGNEVTFLAHESIRINPGFYTEPGSRFVAMIATDTDGDGLPDQWEELQFETLSYGANDLYPGYEYTILAAYLNIINPTGDYDQDGYYNRLEYLALSNPGDANSIPITRTHYEYDALGRIKRIYRVR